MTLATTNMTARNSSAEQNFLELTASPAPGRRFEPTTEKSLDDDLIVLARHLPGASEGLAVIHEFAGGRGIADLVALTRWREGLRRRLDMPQGFLRNETDCTVVAALSPNQTRTVRSLAKRLGMSEEQIQRRLRALMSTGHVVVHGSGYRRVDGLAPIGRAYALEAKVTDWQRGVSQALRYSTWCDAAGVVLLRPPRDIEKVKAHCRTLGLGLGVGGRWIVRPRISKPHSGLRLAMSEQWAQLMAESHTL